MNSRNRDLNIFVSYFDVDELSKSRSEHLYLLILRRRWVLEIEIWTSLSTYVNINWKLKPFIAKLWLDQWCVMKIHFLPIKYCYMIIHLARILLDRCETLIKASIIASSTDLNRPTWIDRLEQSWYHFIVYRSSITVCEEENYWWDNIKIR